MLARTNRTLTKRNPLEFPRDPALTARAEPAKLREIDMSMNQDQITISRNRFRNAVCILNSIDRDEFERAVGLGGARWATFRDDPVLAFLRFDENQAAAIWQIVESRQPEELRTTDQRMLTDASR